MQHDGNLDNFPFRGPLFIKEKSAREQLLHNNHKNRSRPKDFNTDTDTSNTDPPQAKTACNQQKLKLVSFEYPYNHINSM